MSAPDIGPRLRGVSELAVRVVRRIRRDNLSFMAGSVAYQAFMSLLPLVVSIALVATTLLGRQAARRAISLTDSVLPDPVQSLVVPVITGEVSTTAVSVVSFGILVWGAIGLFRTLKTAFESIYGTRQQGSLRTSLTDALVAFGTVVGAVLVAVGAAGTPLLTDLRGVALLSSLGLPVVLTVAFLPVYYLFPGRPLPIRRAVPGAVVAALGWSLLQWAFQFYLQFVASPDVAGVLGTVLVLLTWLYYGSYIILFGALVNATAADRADEQGVVKT